MHTGTFFGKEFGVRQTDDRTIPKEHYPYVTSRCSFSSEEVEHCYEYLSMIVNLILVPILLTYGSMPFSALDLGTIC
jgi:hypothetical protein